MSDSFISLIELSSEYGGKEDYLSLTEKVNDGYYYTEIILNEKGIKKIGSRHFLSNSEVDCKFNKLKIPIQLTVLLSYNSECFNIKHEEKFDIPVNIKEYSKMVIEIKKVILKFFNECCSLESKPKFEIVVDNIIGNYLFFDKDFYHEINITNDYNYMVLAHINDLIKLGDL